MLRSLSGLAAATIVTLGLSACTFHNKACPTSAAIADTASMTVFPPGATPDPSHEVYTVKISDVFSSCDIDKDERSVDSALDITFVATRAPNGGGIPVSVPYFVIVTGDGGKIIARQDFTAHFDFNPGEATTTFKDTVASTVIQLPKEKHAYDYQILVGMRLTKEQLDYNRTVKRYLP